MPLIGPTCTYCSPIRHPPYAPSESIRSRGIKTNTNNKQTTKQAILKKGNKKKQKNKRDLNSNAMLIYLAIISYTYLKTRLLLVSWSKHFSGGKLPFPLPLQIRQYSIGNENPSLCDEVLQKPYL